MWLYNLIFEIDLIVSITIRIWSNSERQRVLFVWERYVFHFQRRSAPSCEHYSWLELPLHFRHFLFRVFIRWFPRRKPRNQNVESFVYDFVIEKRFIISYNLIFRVGLIMPVTVGTWSNSEKRYVFFVRGRFIRRHVWRRTELVSPRTSESRQRWRRFFKVRHELSASMWFIRRRRERWALSLLN